MEKTFREKIILRHGKLMQKHQWLYMPALVVFTLVIGVHDGGIKLVRGWKRYAFTSFLLIMFLVGSSFTYPVFGEQTGFISAETAPEKIAVTESDIELAVEQEVLPEELPLLEDEDVLDGYEEGEFQELREVDKYSLEDILEENHFQGEEAQTADAEGKLFFSADDWRLILINKQHPVPEDYSFTLGTIKGSMQCDERILKDLLGMLQGARKDRIDLIICSPYRDMSRQEKLFNKKIEAYMRKGMSYMEAYKWSSQSVTVPGASEHQIGLALDIVTTNYTVLDAGFADTEAGKWLHEHSHEYGFILRYPKGKEYITGIEFEPWHFRYVGKEAAAAISEQKIALEEFVEKNAYDRGARLNKTVP